MRVRQCASNGRRRVRPNTEERKEGRKERRKGGREEGRERGRKEAGRSECARTRRECERPRNGSTRPSGGPRFLVRVTRWPSFIGGEQIKKTRVATPPFPSSLPRDRPSYTRLVAVVPIVIPVDLRRRSNANTTRSPKRSCLCCGKEL